MSTDIHVPFIGYKIKKGRNKKIERDRNKGKEPRI
jgi:hypothetical protein